MGIGQLVVHGDYGVMKKLTAPWMARLSGVGIASRTAEALLLAAFASGLWSMLSPLLRPAREPAAVVARAVAAPIHTAVDASVVRMHIFGAPAIQEGAASPLAGPIDVSVTGILAADEEKDSLALLSVGGTVKNYSLGQALPDGELVTHIEPTAVVLTRSGEERRIEMDIKFADSNAMFHKASIQGDDKNSWTDAYLDGATGDPAVKAPHTGILSVPAAANPEVKALSLSAIRQERALRFQSLRAKADVAAPTAASHP